MVQPALSYSYNNGGLNNQKLALLGLFLEGARTTSSIILPDLFNFDQASDKKETVPLRDVYRIEPLMAFAGRHGINIRPAAVTGEIGGWDFFAAGSQHIASQVSQKCMRPDDIACDFFRSLIPTDHLTQHINFIAAGIPTRDTATAEESTLLVVQMRIEKDWQLFSAITLQPTVGDNEDFLPSFSDIMAKVVNTFGASFPNAYIVCDEAALPVPIEQIRETCLQVFGVKLSWKSDMLDARALGGLSSLEKSVIDFGMALQASRFVGLTRSSFSNLVTFERYCHDREDVRGHYIYNVPGPYLLERCDNGAYAFAVAAVTVAS